MAEEKKKARVVVVGGGFGGMRAAKALAKHPDLVDVTIVDRRNHHLFQPLLYQIAMAGLSPAEIAVPIRSMFSNRPSVEVILENVTAVNPDSHSLKTSYKELNYDYLILACGAKHSYFGHNEWETYAPGLKTLEQATEIRRRILLAFEEAERELDPERKRQLLTFVIVGGGPTGTELAGALSELTHHTLKRDFRHIDPKLSQIILIEAGPRVMAQFDPKLSERARQDLQRMGVQVRTSTRVTDVNENGVALGGEFIKARTVLWAAGVQPSSLNKTLGCALDKAGRAIVGPDLTIPNHPEIFVIGDQAASTDKDGKPLPGLAPVAMQQGSYVADTIVRSLKGKKRENFHYFDKGQMATIGRKKAIAQVGKLRIDGFIAWLAWLFVHILYLVGFKNRLFVLYDWAWSYLTFHKGARLIVDKEWRSAPGDSISAASPPLPTRAVEKTPPTPTAPLVLPSEIAGQQVFAPRK